MGLSTIFSLFVIAALGVGARVPVDCPRDALYKSLSYDGPALCSGILKAGCTHVPLPTRYSRYPQEKISSYCSCILDSCHHISTSTRSNGTDKTQSHKASSPQHNDTATASATSATVHLTGNGHFSSPSRHATTSYTNTTSSAIPTLTPTPTATTPFSVSLPDMTLAPVGAANFTSATQAAAASLPSCYHLPVASDGKVHEVRLKSFEIVQQDNVTFPFPFIESIFLDTDMIHPLYVSIRDGAMGVHHIDMSDPDHIAIIDSVNTALRIDRFGVHFTTQDCSFDYSVVMPNMYEQVAVRSGKTCSGGNKLSTQSDNHFSQVLYLRDQCGDAVGRSIRKSPLLSIADTSCNVMGVDDKTGKWTFDCLFPSSDSDSSQCLDSVKTMLRNLLYDPFNGACLDLPGVITTLKDSAEDILGEMAIKQSLYQFATNDAERAVVDGIAVHYKQIWSMLQAALANHLDNHSALRIDVDTYQQHRSFEHDACDAAHSAIDSFNMSLHAGATFDQSIAKLTKLPRNGHPVNITVQNPAKVACCTPGRIATQNQTSSICSYPSEALLPENGCICGQTNGGKSVAFKSRGCDSFNSTCQTDDDCGKSGDKQLLCLTGSCCGSGVCFDPFECSQI